MNTKGFEVFFFSEANVAAISFTTSRETWHPFLQVGWLLEYFPPSYMHTASS